MKRHTFGGFLMNRKLTVAVICATFLLTFSSFGFAQQSNPPQQNPPQANPPQTVPPQGDTPKPGDLPEHQAPPQQTPAPAPPGDATPTIVERTFEGHLTKVNVDAKLITVKGDDDKEM